MLRFLCIWMVCLRSVDCHCGCLFAGAFYCYICIVLLEPCLSFRIMETCDKYAHNHLVLIKLSSTHVFNLI